MLFLSLTHHTALIIQVKNILSAQLINSEHRLTVMEMLANLRLHPSCLVMGFSHYQKCPNSLKYL